MKKKQGKISKDASKARANTRMPYVWRIWEGRASCTCYVCFGEVGADSGSGYIADPIAGLASMDDSEGVYRLFS